MPPSTYSLYHPYAQSILARDFVLAFVFVAVVLIAGNISIYGRLFPRVQYILRLVLVGGFYASAILAFHYIH